MNTLENYFFYIDIDNFNDVKDMCYGFNISNNNNELTFNSTNISNSLGGSYVIVNKNDNKIHINSDDISSLYIFYYYENGFYAVSNSFYKLAKELKNKCKVLSINKNFIEQFIDSPLNVHSLYDTLVNEIHILPAFNNLVLTKDELLFEEKEIEMMSKDIDSLEGCSIINNWINKWASIIYSLSNTNIPIQIDLSGGFDSRVIFSICKYGGIDFNKSNINIFSKIGNSIGDKNHLGDDYDVANKIASKLDFSLNNNPNIFHTEISKYSSFEQYDILKQCFMGFHKEGYLCTKFYNKPCVHLGGLNGEIVRGYYILFDKEILNRFHKDPIKKSNLTTEIFYDELNRLTNESAGNKSIAYTKYFINTRCKSHFGMAIYNDYIGNMFLLSPFNDKELLKLKYKDGIDKNLIFAIIIYKTCPEIFDIEFAHGKNFSDEVKTLAKEISIQYPIKNDIRLYDVNMKNEHIYNNDDNHNGEYILYNTFLDNKTLFITKMNELFNDDSYAEKLYEYANSFYLNKDNFYPNKWIMVVTSIIEIFKILYE